MRSKMTMALMTLMVAAFVSFGGAVPSGSNVANGQKNSKAKPPESTKPQAGLFRVVLNGFEVNNESDDDILERDGKRDEVYLRADVWTINRDGSVPYRRSPRSVLMGDINNQDNPPRIVAGTASDEGGLRTNDKWPINEPWRRVRNPLPDRPPMLLWEGTLVQDGNMVMILPTVWEWDSRDPGQIEVQYDQRISSWFEGLRLRCPLLIERRSSSGQELRNDLVFLGGRSGTRPIGINYVGNSTAIILRPLTLTYDAALLAARSTPSNVGYGVLAINYRDGQDHGDYTLYVQVEQIR
jgi:hypothetical protein